MKTDSSKATNALLGTLRKVCAGLPAAEEYVMVHHPAFRVGKKPFAIAGMEEATKGTTLSINLGPDAQLQLLDDARGGPMLFSGPIQPPMLGAAVGSARVHVSKDFPLLQAELKARLELCVRAMEGTRLAPPLRPSPIFQASCDSPRVAFRLAELLKARGFYCCVCVFPAVPMNRPGLRFTVTRHNDPADIAPFVAALDECKSIALAEVARHGDAASA